MSNILEKRCTPSKGTPSRLYNLFFLPSVHRDVVSDHTDLVSRAAISGVIPYTAATRWTPIRAIPTINTLHASECILPSCLVLAQK